MQFKKSSLSEVWKMRKKKKKKSKIDDKMKAKKWHKTKKKK